MSWLVCPPRKIYSRNNGTWIKSLRKKGTIKKNSHEKNVPTKWSLEKSSPVKKAPKKRSLLKGWPENLLRKVEQFIYCYQLIPLDDPTHTYSSHDPTYTKICESGVRGPFFPGLFPLTFFPGIFFPETFYPHW